MSAIPGTAGLAGAGGIDRRTGLGHIATLGAALPANDCRPAAPARRPSRVETLYRQHRAAVARHCRRLLGDVAAAEDATHETFVRVARHIDSAPPGDQALWWMYRIATNYCLNEIRNRRTSAVPSGDATSLCADGPEPACLEESVADREQVRRVLLSLPEQLRAVAVMRHVEGHHDAEVAAALGISRRTVVYRLKEVKRRAARARA